MANAEDAHNTARALARYDPERVTVVHVVEKGGGVPDKTPVEQSEQEAAEAFEAFRETLPDVATEVRYGPDVVDTVLETADDLDATVVAFLPRGGSRFVQLLSGDRTLDLVTAGERPVLALPTPDTGGLDG